MAPVGTHMYSFISTVGSFAGDHGLLDGTQSKVGEVVPSSRPLEPFMTVPTNTKLAVGWAVGWEMVAAQAAMIAVAGCNGGSGSGTDGLCRRRRKLQVYLV